MADISSIWQGTVRAFESQSEFGIVAKIGSIAAFGDRGFARVSHDGSRGNGEIEP